MAPAIWDRIGCYKDAVRNNSIDVFWQPFSPTLPQGSFSVIYTKIEPIPTDLENIEIVSQIF